MKTKILLLLTMLISISVFSQSGINYKAVIKDGSGNILANQAVTMQFTILENATSVYSELHTPTTDANGLIIVIIGEGAIVFGNYSSINWGNGAHFLKVEMADGMGGAIDLGTSKFNTVPYALEAANVTGLEAADEGNGIGHRIIGRNLNNLGDIGLNAVDLSGSPVASTTYGATGEYSVAMNRQTTAQGDFSTAMGLDSKAYGNTSTVMGFNTITNGYDAVAMGAYTVADASQSLAIGRYNVGGGNNQNWNPADPIFEIGIGSGPTARSNALTVLKNGTITAPSLTNSLIDTAGDKALITKEYAEDNYAKKTKEIMIPAYSFVAHNYDDFYFFRPDHLIGVIGSVIPNYASVILPVGATITEMTAYFYIDDRFNDNLEFSLMNKEQSGYASANFLFTLNTLNDGTGTLIKTITSTTPIQIISGYSYFIRIQPDLNTPLEGFSGIQGVKINYTE